MSARASLWWLHWNVYPSQDFYLTLTSAQIRRNGVCSTWYYYSDPARLDIWPWPHILITLQCYVSDKVMMFVSHPNICRGVLSRSVMTQLPIHTGPSLCQGTFVSRFIVHEISWMATLRYWCCLLVFPLHLFHGGPFQALSTYNQKEHNINVIRNNCILWYFQITADHSLHIEKRILKRQQWWWLNNII